MSFTTHIDTPPSDIDKRSGALIRPVAGGKRGRKRPNVFYNDRGFPDQSDDYDYLLHGVDGGRVIRKRKFPAPPLDDIDPAFRCDFIEELHGPKLDAELDLSHLPFEIKSQLCSLITQCWSVFADIGLFVPVKDYECVIDTGSARPISVKKINYGPHETPVMRKCIAALQKVGQISQVFYGRWLFKALLAPKPHQAFRCIQELKHNIIRDSVPNWVGSFDVLDYF